MVQANLTPVPGHYHIGSGTAGDIKAHSSAKMLVSNDIYAETNPKANTSQASFARFKLVVIIDKDVEEQLERPEIFPVSCLVFG